MVPIGMKEILLERGKWNDYLDYFKKKGITYEEIDDVKKVKKTDN
mgnify:CR=1 FL=1